MKRKLIFQITLVVIALIITSIILIKKESKLDTSGYKLIDNLQIEVYSKKNISDLIKEIDKKLITNTKINTKKLGKQEIKFIYENKKGKKRTGIIKIEVVDKENPLIWVSGSYSIKVGSKVNLEEEILCADNYDKNPTCKIEGTYDLNQPGIYNLTYIATDNSGNEEKAAFKLNIYETKKVEETEKNNIEEVSKTIFQEVVEQHKNKNTEIGIDVSKRQKEIDFQKVKDAGATFVMIRVGSQKGIGGEYTLDPYFKENIENAIKNNLKVGVYFYSYADSNKEAKKQATWVLKQIKKYNLSLPIAFDWECYHSFNQMELSLFGLNEVAESFLKKIESAGYDGMLYGSKNYLNSIWKYHDYNVWLAHYTKQTDYKSDYIMWQLCQDGKIDGITTDVDINVLYKNTNKNNVQKY